MSMLVGCIFFAWTPTRRRTTKITHVAWCLGAMAETIGRWSVRTATHPGSGGDDRPRGHHTQARE